MNEHFIDFGLILSYCLILTAFFVAFGYSLRYIIKHPEDSKKTFYVTGGLLLLFLVSWILSSGEPWSSQGIGEGKSKLIGGGLTMMAILIVLAFILLIWSEIINLFRK